MQFTEVRAGRQTGDTLGVLELGPARPIPVWSKADVESVTI